MPSRRAVLEIAFVVLLASASAAVVRDHQKDDSPTYDETYHLLAGAEYVRDGTFTANLEHPPLMKDLAGFCLAGAPIRSPREFTPLDPSPTGRFLPFVYSNTMPPDRMVALGRRAFPWLLALLVAVTYVTARSLFGVSAALLASALVALEPTLVAHAGVIHTDVGAALTMTSATALAMLAARRERTGWWLLAGAALGVALATKFSAVLLFPSFALLPFLELPGAAASISGAGRRRLVRSLGGVLAAFAAGIATLAAIYAWNLRGMTPEAARSAAGAFLSTRAVPAPLAGRLLTISSLSPSLGHYAAGLASVSRLSAGGRGANYFHGKVSEKPSLAYFPVAFAIKTAPSFLLVTAGLFLLGGRELLRRRCLELLIPAAILFAAAMTSSFNIGVRHLLPVYPLLAIAGAGVLAARIPPARFVVVVAALGLGSAVSLTRSHPFEMSYFNGLVGTEGGRAWLSDSNVDWGQDMKRLGDVLGKRGWERDTTVVAYGGLATNYFMREVRLLEPGAPIAPGRYAVGATMEAIGGPFVANIEGAAAGAQVEELVRLLKKEGRRLERVGSITIWELPAAASPPPGVPPPGAPQGPRPG